MREKQTLKKKKEESEAKKVDESESKTHTHTHTHRHPTRTAIISHHNDAQTRSKSWTRSTKGISACFARSKLIEFIMSDIYACKRVCLCVWVCVSYISMCFQWAFNQTLPSCDILNIIYMKCQWNLREASPQGRAKFIIHSKYFHTSHKLHYPKHSQMYLISISINVICVISK